MSVNLVGKDGKIKAKLNDNMEDDTVVVDGEQKSYIEAATDKEKELQSKKDKDE